ncbi:hypothetical protein C0Q70_05451 [Pomacea canaliculata]|uniref:BAR domain-containing protein n=1 Tax=Pomacea canaliculata TaxID=400727 RepID=A0A2T7PL82_POMCA|nr:hypothetical protein C0Q70_05451 [Pomacea canaliculata]
MVASVTKNNETYVSRKMRVQAAPKVLSGAVSDIQLDECRLLQEHEQELEGMSKAIKVLIQHGKEVFDAARQLSQAQKTFAKDLKDLQFQCIDKQTDDETTIVKTLSEFGKYLLDIEQLRETMVNSTELHFIQRLEAFTRNDLDAVKDHKKNFDKQTTIFCQSQERYLGIKSKASESQLKE